MKLIIFLIVLYGSLSAVLADWYIESPAPRLTRSSVIYKTLTRKNLSDLKTINSAVIPIQYTDDFYDYVLRESKIAKIAYHRGVPACGICARAEFENGKRRLYVITLGCLQQFRRYHIGSALLNMVVDYAKRAGGYDSVYLHVQKTNTIGLMFYHSVGFNYQGTIKNYYQSLNDDGYVYEKFLVKSKRDHWAPRTQMSTLAGNPNVNLVYNENHIRQDYHPLEKPATNLRLR